MRSVLITGAFGQVGSALSRIMYQEYELTLTGRTIPPGEKGICLDIRNIVLVFNEVFEVVFAVWVRALTLEKIVTVRRFCCNQPRARDSRNTHLAEQTQNK